jgi:hypothetical protein
LTVTRLCNVGCRARPQAMTTGTKPDTKTTLTSRLVWGRFGILMSIAVLCLTTACAPPPLTSTSISPATDQSYLYGAFAWAEERDQERFSHSFPIIIKLRGDNYTEKLINRVQASQGSCSKSDLSVSCSYSDSRQSRDCFKERCSVVSRAWTVRIRWIDTPGAVNPVVSVNLRVTRQPAS